MHVWALKCKLCNFSDSTDHVNALIFPFRTGIICRWTVNKLLHLKFYLFFIKKILNSQRKKMTVKKENPEE